jgi:phage tail sheath protein FI
MANYRRPDVYLEEKVSFPASIQEVESAVPVFIGYTEHDPTPGAPVQLETMREFIEIFGGPKKEGGITKFEYANGQVKVEPEVIQPQFLLYYAMNHYFDNGGAKCFVLSCGTYPAAFSQTTLKAKIEECLETALEIEEVTLIVIPELVKLADVTQAAPAAGGNPPVEANVDYSDIKGVVDGAANTLIEKQKFEKFFILDVVDGLPKNKDDVKEFDESDFAGLSIEKKGEFMAFYYPFMVSTYRVAIDETAIDALTKTQQDPATLNSVNIGIDPATKQPVYKSLGELKASTNKQESGMYSVVKQQIIDNAPYVILPPSSAMAGVYVAVDNQRGFWKSPANVGINEIRRPNKPIEDTLHEDLNISTLNQRSICAIRTLQGYGTRVMGGRTLRGSSNDFRYINVRRFVSIAEKSIKNSLKQFLFEPNNPDTWARVTAGISAYLSDKWSQGALLGAKAEDSFFVRLGLGTTMNQTDVLQGRMKVEIGLAVVRPAEFIILQFEQFLPTKL